MTASCYVAKYEEVLAKLSMLTSIFLLMIRIKSIALSSSYLYMWLSKQISGVISVTETKYSNLHTILTTFYHIHAIYYY